MKDIKLILERKDVWYKPLFVNDGNNLYEIFKIHFFDKNGVVFTNNSGFFPLNDIDIILTNFKLDRKNEVSFNDNNECFIVKANTCIVSDNSLVELYIPIALLKDLKVKVNVPFDKNNYGEQLYRDEYEFILGNEKVTVYDHFTTEKNEASIRRTELFNLLGINEISIFDIMKLLKYIKDNNININDII